MNDSTLTQTGTLINLEVNNSRLLSYDEFIKCADFLPANILMHQNLWWLGTQSPDFKDNFFIRTMRQK